jgi:hypothetical protein
MALHKILGHSQVAVRLELYQVQLHGVSSAMRNDTIKSNLLKMDKSVESHPFSYVLIHPYEKYHHFNKILS